MVSDFELVVIRHFPTEGNRKRQYVGWTDEPIQEIEAPVLDFERTDVYGSDLLRAKQTAQLLFPRAMYHADARFRECHFGEYEGKTYAQLELDTHYRNWIDDSARLAPPGGESLQQVESRVLEAFSELPNGARLVTHGGPIRLLLARFAPEPREFWSWDVPHGAMFRFTWNSECAFKEGQRCTSLSAEPQTASDTM